MNSDEIPGPRVANGEFSVGIPSEVANFFNKNKDVLEAVHHRITVSQGDLSEVVHETPELQNEIEGAYLDGGVIDSLMRMPDFPLDRSGILAITTALVTNLKLSVPESRILAGLIASAYIGRAGYPSSEGLTNPLPLELIEVRRGVRELSFPVCLQRLPGDLAAQAVRRFQKLSDEVEQLEEENAPTGEYDMSFLDRLLESQPTSGFDTRNADDLLAITNRDTEVAREKRARNIWGNGLGVLSRMMEAPNPSPTRTNN